MALVRFYPNRFNEISKEFDRAVNHLFADMNVKNFNKADHVWQPKVNIGETDNEFSITVELPGVDKKDIEISYENDVLKISGERKREASDDNSSYLREERYYGKFSRSFNINTKINNQKIEADYKDGLLTVHLPKAEEVKPKEIKIK